MLDIFNSDAFSVISLTDRVNKMPFVPGRAGKLGIFDEEGVRTTTIAIEEANGLLSLIPSSPRGGPGFEHKRNKAKLRHLNIPHLELNDSVYPGEVQNVRLFGSDEGGADLAGVQAVVDGRLAEMMPKHDATVEYGRLGALKGIILDADGSTVIYNLFTEFGVSQDTVDFVLGTTTTNIIAKINTVKGLVEDELGAVTYDHVHCFAGKTWFQEFISHPQILAAYQYYASAPGGNPLRDDLRYNGFEFGGVIFEQYRGNVGGIAFIADAEATFFPVGVPGLYKTYYAPADYMETVNTIGLPRYSKQAPDPEFNRYRRLNTQSNPLSLCLRPKVLVKGTTSN